VPKQTSFLLALLIFCSTANASFFAIPDGDTAIQFQTWVQSVRQNAQLAKIIADTQTLTQYALETSRAANAAVNAVNNVRYIIRNPVDFLSTQMQEFDDVFPEASNTYRDLMVLKESVNSFGSERDNYDPYALQEALFYARKTGKNLYELKSRAMDRDNISSPHDALTRQLREQKRQVDELFNTLELASGLGGVTPQEAVLFQARAAAQQARATVMIASHQNEMARLAKIQFNNSVEEKVQSQNIMKQELHNMKALVPKDLSLNPWR